MLQSPSMPPLPQPFLDMLAAENTPIFSRLPAALDGEAPSVALRLNPAKVCPDTEIVANLYAGTVAWEPAGRYLSSRPLFTFDPLLHQGAYYVQDPSSMITGHIIRSLISSLPARPLAMLDACAAPGGKTTAALAALPAGSVMVANEFTPSRVAPLAENLARWGNPNAVVTAGSVDRFARIRDAFDIIAVDAPCSGEGMMRKDADARTQWSAGLVKQCASLQREILTSVWPSLRPGGYLIYSTCTFNVSEDEDNLAWLVETLGGEPVDIPIDSAWGISGTVKGPYPAMRFIPGLIRGEGLFAAVVRKPGLLPETVGKPLRRRQKKTVEFDSLLSDSVAFEAVGRPDGSGVIDLMPASPLLPHEIAAFGRPVVTLGTVKGRDLIPDSSLALSGALRKGAFPEVDVDAQTAIAFLRCEALVLPGGVPKGIVLLRHAGLPLGFVKNLGRRANNLHRHSWRIISAGEPVGILAL